MADENKVKVEVEDGAAEAPSEPAETHEMTEEEMVEAAKRAGAEAAEAELAAEKQQDLIDLEARAVEAETRLEEAESAAQEANDKLLRLQADWENFHASASENSEVVQFAEGVSAVHAKIVTVLEKEGVETIDPAGQPFNPLDHQAVGRVEDAEAYDETVAQVFLKGYRMGGKVIRPAMVSVTTGGPKRPAEEPAEGTESE